MKFDLQPLSNVEASSDQAFDWKATNGDPQFSISNWEILRGRALRISFRLATSNSRRSVCIFYMDTGTGMSEQNALRLSVDADGNVDQEIAFPETLRALRFDPLAHPGLFSLVDFNIEILARSNEQIKRLLDSYHIVPTHTGALDQLGNPVTELTYENWIKINETPRQRYNVLRERAASWDHKPLISVVMPTYQTPEKWLRKAIDSVLDQVYENWEFCIADDCSASPHVKAILDEYAAKDRRFKVTYRTENGHISAASNTALDMATGEFVALLDHDDELHPLALFYVAEAIRAFPNAALIYSDEDKISVEGVRSEPYFKCDFNYDLFLNQNMICHLGAYKTSSLKAIGGFRLGFEGAQDYDLALRVLDQAGAENIYHIPRVLYHWRVIPESTASTHEAKPYAVSAAARALAEHLERNKVPGKVEPAPDAPAFNKISYIIPDPHPRVEIIIPTRDAAGLVRQCVDSIREKTVYDNYLITIIDNGSTEQETFDLFESFKDDDRIRVARDDSPFNYSALNNRVGLASEADFVCLMNNDIEVITPTWLYEMMSIAIQPGVGAVGSKLLYPNDTLQHGGVIVGLGGVAGHSHKHSDRKAPGYFFRTLLRSRMSAVTAACLVIRTSIFREVGGLDEKLQVAFNDVDFCLRVQKAGHRNVWTPYAELYHHESASRGYEDTPEKIARFDAEVAFVKQRWGETLLNDPCYSPNLSLDTEDFSMAWHSRVPDFL
ncbi:glycosyltransferase family 2 protein [Paraburkholderia lacunae]|uniref:Glycosyl transferase family 2 n=1 Tax=Paraburkholderia lacunae TaxID=2211104 RepID=A0A370MZF6_9BURK|nr:glycosyltransferase family 2 protein [Paraburkholderia lacunae]RDJ98735.1 glycosyl transferase family 2 [Paraburkholderia lacunae]